MAIFSLLIESASFGRIGIMLNNFKIVRKISQNDDDGLKNILNPIINNFLYQFVKISRRLNQRWHRQNILRNAFAFK